MKLLTKLIVLAGVFLASWFGLREINWLSAFGIRRTSISLENRLGEAMWKTVGNTNFEVTESWTASRPDLCRLHAQGRCGSRRVCGLFKNSNCPKSLTG